MYIYNIQYTICTYTIYKYTILIDIIDIYIYIYISDAIFRSRLRLLHSVSQCVRRLVLLGRKVMGWTVSSPTRLQKMQEINVGKILPKTSHLGMVYTN